MMISKKDGAVVSKLFNSILVAELMMRKALEDSNSESWDLWYSARAEATESLQKMNIQVLV